MKYIKLSIMWLVLLICVIPVLNYAKPPLVTEEISLNRDGTYYMEVTNKGLVSLQDRVSLFETVEGRQFRGTFALNFIQVWITPTDYRRAEGKRFLARIEMATGTLPVVTLIKSVD